MIIIKPNYRSQTLTKLLLPFSSSFSSFIVVETVVKSKERFHIVIRLLFFVWELSSIMLLWQFSPQKLAWIWHYNFAQV